ncbi:hypothetical protein SAMN05192549_103191 [Duganella sacchari]|uniref:Lipoprotein-attachment site-containing protein n=1 Tax=Duganella sacchari TaxID=551987 RepID=A0A1M7MK13_9BURK|nr:hypothetical protein SAMN05192549_103191 [Duganella sacchari]
MLKPVLFTLFVACGLAGCADMGTIETTQTAPMQSASAEQGQRCSVDEPSTGQRVGKRTCR